MRVTAPPRTAVPFGSRSYLRLAATHFLSSAGVLVFRTRSGVAQPRRLTAR